MPDAFVRLLDAIKLRQTYIGQFELLAAIAPFISLPAEWFQGRPVELWIDNSSAVSALVKGYSGKPDCARLVNMFHFAIARLGLASCASSSRRSGSITSRLNPTRRTYRRAPTSWEPTQQRSSPSSGGWLR